MSLSNIILSAMQSANYNKQFKSAQLAQGTPFINKFGRRQMQLNPNPLFTYQPMDWKKQMAVMALDPAIKVFGRSRVKSKKLKTFKHDMNIAHARNIENFENFEKPRIDESYASRGIAGSSLHARDINKRRKKINTVNLENRRKYRRAKKQDFFSSFFG